MRAICMYCGRPFRYNPQWPSGICRDCATSELMASADDNPLPAESPAGEPTTTQPPSPDSLPPGSGDGTSEELGETQNHQS